MTKYRTDLPQLTMSTFMTDGGCCGTDHTHMEEICEIWFEE